MKKELELQRKQIKYMRQILVKNQSKVQKSMRIKKLINKITKVTSPKKKNLI